MDATEWHGSCPGCGRKVDVYDRTGSRAQAAAEDASRRAVPEEAPLVLLVDPPLGVKPVYCSCTEQLPIGSATWY